MTLSRDQELPLVSIVVLLQQHADVIGAAMASCLSQAYTHVEVIVVSDGSDERAWEIVRRYEPRVRIVRVPRQAGSCVARNVGLAYATGPFVLFHDGDDLLFPDRLWHDLDIFAQHPATDMVISLNRWFEDGASFPYDPEPVCRRERRLLQHLSSLTGASDTALAGLLHGGGPQHSCIVYRTAVVRGLGGYAEGTEPYADRELLFRAVCRRARVSLNPRVTCAWRVYDSPRRLTPALRPDDAVRRLALANRYASVLGQTGLLGRPPLRQALIAHVLEQVCAYANARREPEVARSAMRLASWLDQDERRPPTTVRAPSVLTLAAVLTDTTSRV